MAVRLDSPDALEVICFPLHSATISECRRRMEELVKAGVRAIVPRGRSMVGGVRVLGKGHASVVFLADTVFGLKAVKVRRTDSKRMSLVGEAELLSLASRHRLAPRPYAWGRDFIVMDYLEGTLLGDVDPQRLGGSGARKLLAALLGKAYVLDLIGVDHGELSRPHRHVMLVGLEPFFLDFESASTSRRPNNLTSLASALLVKPSRLSSSLRRAAGLEGLGVDEIVEALRAYKKNPGPSSLRNLLLLLLSHPNQ